MTLPGRNPNGPSTEMPGPRVFFVTGKVLLDDGSAPPEPVAIKRVCSGFTRNEGYTDGKGHFSIQLGQSGGVFDDASDGMDMETRIPGSQAGRDSQIPGMGSQTIRTRDLAGCDLEASLAGFRSDHVSLDMRRPLDNPEVGTIVLHRLSGVQGLTISATSMQAPKGAKKDYEKALNAMKKQKWEDARKDLEKSVAAYPKYAVAWERLGEVQERENQFDQARASYSKALEADSKFVSPYEHLSAIAVREQKWQDAADASDRLLRLNPVDFPQVWMMNAIAYYQLARLDVAEKSAREGIKADPKHEFPKLEHILGVILAQRHSYPEAAEHMRTYLRLDPQASDADMVKQQLAQLEKVTGPPPADAATQKP